MNQPADTQLEPIFEPSNRQLERAARIRRFNRIYVFLPISLASIIALALTILLIFLALGIGTVEVRETISGIADSVLILTIIPTMVLCAIVPTAFIAISIQTRQRGIAPIRQTQWFFWRVQDRFGFLGIRIGRLMEKFREPIMRISARYAYLQTFLIRLIKIFKRG